MAEVERQEKSFFIELGLKDSDGVEMAKSAAHCSSYYVGLPSNCSFSRTVLLEKGKEYSFFARIGTILAMWNGLFAIIISVCLKSLCWLVLSDLHGNEMMMMMILHCCCLIAKHRKHGFTTLGGSI